jgi:hypothetical protein
MVAEAEASMAAKSPSGWRVVCSCGWDRECSSEWAADSVSKLHPQLAPVDVTHMTRVEGPPDTRRGQQLTLT